MSVKSSRWMITLWDFNEAIRFNQKKHLMKYVIIGEETCPTTLKLHYHAYVEFLKEYSISSVKSILKCKDIHCEIARLCRETCTGYTIKDGNVVFKYEKWEDSPLLKQDHKNIFDQFPIE